jgi:dihydrodipicolinate synthase/N-acetylneuraminate lyase
MARRGWIRYCKESSESVDYFNLLISNAKAIGLKVLQGSEACVAASLLDGACGIVPCCANFEPQTFVRAYHAAQRRDVVELWRCQERIRALRQNLLREPKNWLGGLKYAVSTLGVGSGKPVSPLQPLDENERKRIDNFLRQEPQEMRPGA